MGKLYDLYYESRLEEPGVTGFETAVTRHKALDSILWPSQEPCLLRAGLVVVGPCSRIGASAEGKEHLALLSFIWYPSRSCISHGSLCSPSAVSMLAVYAEVSASLFMPVISILGVHPSGLPGHAWPLATAVDMTHRISRT